MAITIYCLYLLMYVAFGITIPVLDISLPLSELVISFEDALKTYGFFYIKNHGISSNILDQAFNQSHIFFQQSSEFKTQHRYNNNRGYINLSNESGQIGFNNHQIIPDQKEGLVLMWPEYEINKPFYGQNNWPNIHNNGINEFKYVFEEYKREMYNLNMKLIKLFALSLGFSEDYFFTGNNMLFVADQLLQIALWHYIAIKSNVSNGIYACGEHSDWDFMSILAIGNNNDSQGLQVRINDNWYDMEYKKDLLIVNSGNMARVMTNGYYKSSYHRVVLDKQIDRYSIVYFVSPNYEWKLSCIGKNCQTEEKEPYLHQDDMDLNAGQYLSKMFYAHTHGYSLKHEL